MATSDILAHSISRARWFLGWLIFGAALDRVFGFAASVVIIVVAAAVAVALWVLTEVPRGHG